MTTNLYAQKQRDLPHNEIFALICFQASLLKKKDFADQYKENFTIVFAVIESGRCPVYLQKSVINMQVFISCKRNEWFNQSATNHEDGKL